MTAAITVFDAPVGRRRKRTKVEYLASGWRDVSYPKVCLECIFGPDAVRGTETDLAVWRITSPATGGGHLVGHYCDRHRRAVAHKIGQPIDTSELDL